jgi:hypothetical protein
MYAFEVGVDDLMGILGCSEEKAAYYIDVLDMDAVEEAALHGDDIDEQTNYAYDEIRRQLAEME